MWDQAAPSAMDLRALTHEEMQSFLQRERILRLGLDADDERYLVPLGYVWLDGFICCVTLSGRKTQMLGRNPRVSFQVDDSATQGGVRLDQRDRGRAR